VRSAGIVFAGLVLVAVVASVTAGAHAAPSAGQAAREGRASRAFRAGDYAGALELYRELLEETGHPIYLRNIARCHQLRREPEPALAYFRRYRDEHAAMSDSERREIAIYIAEMEALRDVLQRRAPPFAPAAERAAAPPPAHVTPVADREVSPAVRHWPWVALAAAVVAAGATAAYFALRPRPCPAGYTCF
jgi:hypothetical protein